MKSHKKKIFRARKYYNSVITTLPDGRMMEQPKAYVYTDVFKENSFISTITKYNCPYCQAKEETDKHELKREQENTIINIYCEGCKKLLLREELTKQEVKE